MADIERVVRSESVQATRELGRRLGGALVAGDVVALSGPLGAGKTQFVKGIARGLGVTDERTVNSPTFVLVNEYDGRLHLFHVDAYRLSGARALEALGFAEMCDAGGVVVVEWADRVREALPGKRIEIEIEPTGDTTRALRVRAGAEAAGRVGVLDAGAGET